jgi:hypothetical protein
MHAILNCGGIVSYINVYPELENIMGYFTTTNTNRVNPQVFVKIKNHYENIPFSDQLDNEHNFRLLGSTYIYNSHSQNYRVLIDNKAQGVINTQAQTIEWNLNEQPLLPRNFFHLMILDPLSLISLKFNTIILHAAALSTEQGAVLVLGDSGYGKSTLCFLASRGQNIKSLSDDTVAVNGNSILTAHPIPTGFGLAPDLLSTTYERNNVLQKSRGKIYYKEIPNMRTEPQKIKSVIFLRKFGAEKTTILPLSHLQALKYLIDSQTSIGNPYNNIRFQLFKRISSETNCYEIKYPELCDLELFKRTILEVE